MHPSDSIADYLDALAARQSTPGGGAVAAMSGAQGCALISMVCRFTKGNALQAELERAEAARAACIDFARNDIESFDGVMAVWKQGGPELQAALKTAATVPMELIETLSALADDVARLEQDGNSNLITDTGIAAQQFVAAIDAAHLNVLVNLKSIEDNDFCAGIKRRLDETLPVKTPLNEIAERILSELNA